MCIADRLQRPDDEYNTYISLRLVQAAMIMLLTVQHAHTRAPPVAKPKSAW